MTYDKRFDILEIRFIKKLNLRKYIRNYYELEIMVALTPSEHEIPGRLAHVGITSFVTIMDENGSKKEGVILGVSANGFARP